MANPDPWKLHCDRGELQRLILHIERALVAQTRLRSLLIAAGKTVGDHRRTLNDVRARIPDAQRVSRGRAPRHRRSAPTAPHGIAEPRRLASGIVQRHR